MKELNELTEQEILKLTDSDVNMLVKLKKAKEGIPLLEKPKEPEYFEIPPHDKIVYTCSLFGDSVVFESIEEMNNVLEEIRKSKSKSRLDYDYNKLGSDFKYAISELKKPYDGDWDSVKTIKAYSKDLYDKISDFAKQNKKTQESFESANKEYHAQKDNEKWIQDEIWDRVYEVRDKYYKLNTYCAKMINDYMPIAENNEKIALSFLVKAYSLNQEDSDYVLANYKS